MGAKFCMWNFFLIPSQKGRGKFLIGNFACLLQIKSHDSEVLEGIFSFLNVFSNCIVVLFIGLQI